MHYVGVIIQRVWAEEPTGRRSGRTHHRRAGKTPASVRRRATQPGTRTD